MAFVLLLLLSLPIAFLLFLLPKLRQMAGKLSPPGPPGLPLLGNLHQLDNCNLPDKLWKLSKQYGPVMSLQLGFRPALVISSPEMAKEVMKTQDLTFCSRPPLMGQEKYSYNGLDVALSPYNSYWREMRKIMSVHLFSFKKVQSFRHIREDEVFEMINRISSSNGSLVNLSEVIMSLVVTIICRVGFGKKLDEVYAHRFHAILTETQELMANFYISDYFPLLGWVDKLNRKCGRLENNFKDMDLFYQELIDEHLSPERPSSMQDDVIDILLKLKEEGDKKSSIDLTFDNIKAMLMNVFLGGTETNAATVIWILTCLVKNPKAMKKAQEEVRILIGTKGRVDEEDLHNIKLPYLKAVIKEGLRLYPVVPLMVPRESMEKSVVNGYEIKSETVVYVNAWAIGRDPKAWENPEEFSPERFLDSPIEFKGQDFEFIPFGAGRRGCPGMQMGIITVELIISNLLYSFDWELPSGMKEEDIDTEVLPGITMHKKNALSLLAKKYNGI